MNEVCVPLGFHLSPGPCPGCHSPRVKVDSIEGLPVYACVYCSPEKFPPPEMSASADTAELDRLRAENKRMRQAIEESVWWLQNVADLHGDGTATFKTVGIKGLIGKLRYAIKENL